jgi:hypothetical protein
MHPGHRRDPVGQNLQEGPDSESVIAGNTAVGLAFFTGGKIRDYGRSGTVDGRAGF